MSHEKIDTIDLKQSTKPEVMAHKGLLNTVFIQLLANLDRKLQEMVLKN